MVSDLHFIVSTRSKSTCLSKDTRKVHCLLLLSHTSIHKKTLEEIKKVKAPQTKEIHTGSFYSKGSKLVE